MNKRIVERILTDIKRDLQLISLKTVDKYARDKINNVIDDVNSEIENIRL